MAISEFNFIINLKLVEILPNKRKVSFSSIEASRLVFLVFLVVTGLDKRELQYLFHLDPLLLVIEFSSFFSYICSGGGAGGQRGQLPLQLEDQQLRRNFGRKIFEFSYSAPTHSLQSGHASSKDRVI